MGPAANHYMTVEYLALSLLPFVSETPALAMRSPCDEQSIDIIA